MSPPPSTLTDMTTPCTDSEEQWRPAPGLDGYEVSNYGRVRGVDRTLTNRNGVKRRWKGRIRVLTPIGFGYPGVWLKGKVYPVHRLVCEAFHGPRPEGLVTLHLDGDPTNNRSENLAWGTQSKNIQQSVTDKTHVHARKTTCPNGHPYDAMNGPNHRRCRRCHAANERMRAQRKRESHAGM